MQNIVASVVWTVASFVLHRFTLKHDAHIYERVQGLEMYEPVHSH